MICLAYSISLAKLAATLKKRPALEKQLQRILQHAQSGPFNPIDNGEPEELRDIPDSSKFIKSPDGDIWARMRELLELIQKTPELRGEIVDAFIRRVFEVMTDHADDDKKSK